MEALEDRWLPSTLVVMNNLDSGPGSLRAEIAAAKNKDTINFASTLNDQTITLSSELDITHNVTIQGLGAAHLTISGGGWSRVFEVAKSTSLSVRDLTISNGNTAGDGAGIYINYRGNLTVTGCILSGNSARRGGAIFNYGGGTVIVSNTFLSGNIAIPSFTGEGGAIYNNGVNGGTVTISGCNFSDNSAYEGGAIYEVGLPITVSDSTFSNNTPDDIVNG
jgi:hypothetical protein